MMAASAQEQRKFLYQERLLRRQALRPLESGSLQRKAAACNSAGQTALKVDVIHDIHSPQGLLLAIKNAAGIGKDIVMSKIHTFSRRTHTSIF